MSLLDDPQGHFRPSETWRNGMFLYTKIESQRLTAFQLLILGRPGSGCTSLLNVLSNNRDTFNEVTGETRYGNMDHVAARQFRQQIMFNNEGKQ